MYKAEEIVILPHIKKSLLHRTQKQCLLINCTYWETSKQWMKNGLKIKLKKIASNFTSVSSRTEKGLSSALNQSDWLWLMSCKICRNMNLNSFQWQWVSWVFRHCDKLKAAQFLSDPFQYYRPVEKSSFVFSWYVFHILKLISLLEKDYMIFVVLMEYFIFQISFEYNKINQTRKQTLLPSKTPNWGELGSNIRISTNSK